MRLNPEGMTQPSAYTHLVAAGDYLFIAGQVALDGDGEVVGRGDMGAQLRQVLENIKTILESQGADFSDIVKITVFTTNIDMLRQHGDIREEYFGGHAPASTAVSDETMSANVLNQNVLYPSMSARSSFSRVAISTRPIGESTSFVYARYTRRTIATDSR